MRWSSPLKLRQVARRRVRILLQRFLVFPDHFEHGSCCPPERARRPANPRAGGPQTCRLLAATGRMLGRGDPIRVKRGERVLFHALNAGATEIRSLALPGHVFRIIALDGICANTSGGANTMAQLGQPLGRNITCQPETNPVGSLEGGLGLYGPLNTLSSARSS